MSRNHEAVRSAPAAEAGTILSDLGNSYLLDLSVDAWMSMKSHPRRRDVERQARKDHLRAARLATGPVFESLRSVVAAELEGVRYKVDGHARALLWARGELQRPRSVIVHVYRVKTRQELNDIHRLYDSQLAAATLFDRVTGAYCENGLELKSPRLKSGTIVDALAIATRGFARSPQHDGDEEEFDVYAAVGAFRDELVLLDSVNPQADFFPTGIVAAALLSLAQSPSTLTYFRRLSAREGSKKVGVPDPVEALLSQLARLKQRKGSRTRSEQEDLCARSLAAVDAWSAGPESPSYWGELPLHPHLVAEAVIRVRSRRRVVGEQG